MLISKVQDTFLAFLGQQNEWKRSQLYCHLHLIGWQE